MVSGGFGGGGKEVGALNSVSSAALPKQQSVSAILCGPLFPFEIYIYIYIYFFLC